MQRLVFIPDVAHFDHTTPARWQLIDREGVRLREGVSAMSDAPGANRTIAIVPTTRTAHIETALPPVSKHKRDQLLNFAIEDKLTLDPATVHAVVLGPSQRGSNLYIVAAIERQWFAAALRWVDEVCGPVDLVLTESALATVPLDQWLLTIINGHGAAIRSDGLAYAVECDPINGQLNDPPFALTLALNEAAATDSMPSHLVIFADPPARAAIDILRWQHKLNSGGASQTLRVEFAESSGSAGRFNPNVRANLRGGTFALSGQAAALIQALRPALLLAAVMLCLHISFVAFDAWRLAKERRNIESEMRQTFLTSFPQATAVIDPTLQMSRNLATVQRERGLASDPVRIQLARAAALVGDAAEKVASVSYVDGTLSMTLTSLSTDQNARIEAVAAVDPRIRTTSNGTQRQVSFTTVDTR